MLNQLDKIRGIRRVDSVGRVTIPAFIREALCIRHGDEMLFLLALQPTDCGCERERVILLRKAAKENA